MLTEKCQVQEDSIDIDKEKLNYGDKNQASWWMVNQLAQGMFQGDQSVLYFDRDVEYIGRCIYQN